jgi:hypothetical protein
VFIVFHSSIPSANNNISILVLAQRIIGFNSIFFHFDDKEDRRKEEKVDSHQADDEQRRSKHKRDKLIYRWHSMFIKNGPILVLTTS